MKFYEMESIKKILGLPSQVSVKQIEARLSELLAKEVELEALKSKGEEIKESANSLKWWRSRS
jgi:hypothetical protein